MLIARGAEGYRYASTWRVTNMSRNQKLLLVSIVVTGILAYSGYKLYWLFTPHRGAAFETKEIKSASFKIRITAYEEKGVWLPGAFYVFESSSIGSSDSREVMSVHADDTIPIPREVARIVNEETAYLYMHNLYAVTTDGARTWSIWDAVKELRDRQDVFSRSIEEVEVDADGSGRMRLYRFRDESPTDTRVRKHFFVRAASHGQVD